MPLQHHSVVVIEIVIALAVLRFETNCHQGDVRSDAALHSVSRFTVHPFAFI
jgi:hypothetical protein